MEVGNVKIAEDKDFEKLKKLYDDNNDWRLDYNKPDLSVWTKTVPGISFRMVKVNLFEYKYSLASITYILSIKK